MTGGGWIKVEKSLSDDPRVIRIASRLRNADVTLGERAHALVVGALVRIWWYADTHIRSDDTIDLGKGELDAMIGVPGFCDLLPEDWLEVVNDSTVKLPGFQAHNGVEAKNRALGAKRASRHRAKSNAASVTSPSRTALPDQTRPDQTREREGAQARPSRSPSRATRLPEDFALTPKRRAVAEAEGVDPDRTFAKFCSYWRGNGHRRADWDAQWQLWCSHEIERGRGKAGSLPKRKQPPTDVEIAEARRKAAADNAEQVRRLGLAAAAR